MPIGPGTYPQGAKFSLVRSWIKNFVISDILLPGGNTGNVFIFFPATDPLRSYHITLQPNAWAWNSNFYTLDFWVKDSYRVLLATGAIDPMPFTLLYMPPTPTTAATVAYRPFNTFTPDYVTTLPPATQPYWLPVR